MSVTVKPVITQTNATVQVNGVTVIPAAHPAPFRWSSAPTSSPPSSRPRTAGRRRPHRRDHHRASQSRLSDLQLSAGPLQPELPHHAGIHGRDRAVCSGLHPGDGHRPFRRRSDRRQPVHSGGAPVTCTGATSPWNCPLGVGGNVISVTVTAADNTTHVYTVTFSRRRCDAQRPGAVGAPSTRRPSSARRWPTRHRCWATPWPARW